MRELALFAGAGGGILGGTLIGFNTVCAVEIEDYPRKVLLQRQLDGILHRFPIWDDIKTFDGRPWKGAVDIITGGFPCQDISAAGKGAGISGKRSGLWGEMARVVREIRPPIVFVENSPMLTGRGLGTVLGDLAAVGYNARWCVLGASDTGAPHKRERIWILAYSSRIGGQEPQRTGRNTRDRVGNKSQTVSHANSKQLDKQRKPQRQEKENPEFSGSCKIEWWDIDPADLPDTDCDKQHRRPGNVQMGRGRIQRDVKEGVNEKGNQWGFKSKLGRVAYGVAHRVDRLKAIGNGQVPAVAAIAFIILSEGIVR